MTRRFKVGDKVQRQPGGNWLLPSGKTFTVQSVGVATRRLHNVEIGDQVIGVDFPKAHNFKYPAKMFTLVASVEPTDAELAAAYRAAGAENRRLFNELTKRGYTMEAMFDGSRRKLRTADSDTRYISKFETKRVEL